MTAVTPLFEIIVEDRCQVGSSWANSTACHRPFRTRADIWCCTCHRSGRSSSTGYQLPGANGTIKTQRFAKPDIFSRRPRSCSSHRRTDPRQRTLNHRLRRTTEERNATFSCPARKSDSPPGRQAGVRPRQTPAPAAVRFQKMRGL